MQIKVMAVEVFAETKSPKRNSSGSESGGYLLSHNKCSTIGVAGCGAALPPLRPLPRAARPAPLMHCERGTAPLAHGT